MRVVSFALLSLVLSSVGALAQSTAEQEVRRVNDAILAASAKGGDKAAYAKLVGDDLRWINVDGTILTKAQRLAQIGGGPPPTFRDIDVRIYGETAVMVARAEDSNGSNKRVTQRVFVKRGGQWQLIGHSAIPIK